MDNYMHQMEPTFSEQDIAGVAACVASSWVSEGARTAAFEEQLAAHTGVKYATALPSCTVALAVSLMALDIGPGDEVLVPNLTFIATANAVNLAGATPVLVDIHPDNLGMDVEVAERAITQRTRAIMPVWFNGRAPYIAELGALASEHDLALVEDAACAIGSQRNGKHSGSFGDVGCFSFNTTKIITTSTGGMTLTDSIGLHQRVRRLKNHGRLDRRDFHPLVGFNFSFSDLLAALGLSQMASLPERVAHMHEIYGWYHAQLGDVAGVEMLPPDPQTCPWYADVYVSDAVALHRFLESRRIQSRLFYPPIHTQPVYRQKGDFPHSTRVSSRGLWLPSAAYVSEEDVRRVCDAIAEWASSVR